LNRRLAARRLVLVAKKACAILLATGGLVLPLHAGLAADANVCTNEVPHRFAGIWATDVPTAGFRRGVQEAGFALGFGLVTPDGRDKCSHYLELSKISYGWLPAGTVAENYCWRGNWEVLEEIFAGAQSHPLVRYAVGETTVLRYNFATGTRWMPFVDGGFGVMATDIGRPNLGSVFEFNEFGGLGVNYFWRADSALDFEYRFTHISNGGVANPNGGLDGHIFYVGVSWFF
jgi:opacity protein-like surface antigen